MTIEQDQPPDLPVPALAAAGPLLTAREGAALLRVSEPAFRRRVANGILPKPAEPGGMPRSELIAVIEAAKRRRTEPETPPEGGAGGSNGNGTIARPALRRKSAGENPCTVSCCFMRGMRIASPAFLTPSPASGETITRRDKKNESWPDSPR